jgi:hypothetical protein
MKPNVRIRQVNSYCSQYLSSLCRGLVAALLWTALFVFAGGAGAQTVPQATTQPPPGHVRVKRSHKRPPAKFNSVRALSRYISQVKAKAEKEHKKPDADAAEPDRDADVVKPPAGTEKEPDRDAEAEKTVSRNGRKTNIGHLPPDKDDDETLDALGALLFYTRQRSYPHDTIDWSAYRRAIAHRNQMRPGLVGAGARGAGLPGSGVIQTDGVNGNRWEFIGPRNLTTAYTVYNGPSEVSGRVNALAYDPGAPGTYYLGSAGGGVWKTVDGGATWTPLSDGWPSVQVSSIALDPTNPHIIYVGTGDFPGFGGLSFGIMKSTDGGATWTNIGNAELGGYSVNQILVDPDNPQIITVAAGRLPNWYTSIWRSTDGGQTWKEAVDSSNHAVDPGVAWCNVVCGAKDSQGNRMYYATGLYDYVEVWRSADRGATWTKLSPPLTSPDWYDHDSTLITASPTSPTTVYLIDGYNRKLLKSTNSGTTWTDITNNFPTGGSNNYNWSQAWYDLYIACSTRLVNGVKQDVLYAGTLDIQQSLNGGASWRSIGGPVYSNAALLHTDQHCLAVNPSNPNEMLVGNDGGVYRLNYDPVADSWSYTSLNANLGITQFYAAAYHPTDPTQIMGGTQDNGTPASLGDLVNWSTVSGGDGGGCAINPSNPSIQYSTAQGFYMLETTDGWQNNVSYIAPTSTQLGSDTLPFITYLTMDPTNPSQVYVGTNYLWRWNDSSSTWTARLGNKPLAGSGWVILSIAVDPHNGSRIFTGSEDGQVWMTTTGGTSWTKISGGSLPNNSITSITVDPSNANDLIVTLSGTGVPHVWRGTLSGTTATWTSISGSGANSVPDAPADGLALDPNDPQHTYYLATDVGVFMTSDSGADWTNITQPLGLPDAQVFSITVVPGTHYLQAATYGRGLWRISLAQANAQITGLTLDPTSVVAGHTANATIYFASGVPSGTTVNLTSSNTSVATVPSTLPVTAGATQATFSVTTLVSGPTTTSDIKASINGTSATQTLTITAPTLLTVPDQAGAVGDKVTLTGTLQEGTTGISGKTVTFKVDGTSVGSAVTDAGGTASLDYTVPVSLGGGTHTIQAAFAGDSDYNQTSGSGTLTTHFNTLLQLPNVSGIGGQSVALRAAIRRYPDGVFLTGKTVTFKIDGNTVGTATTQSNYIASLSYTIPASVGPGTHTLSASFAGDSDYNTCTQTATLTVHDNTLMQLPPASGIAGQSVLLRAAIRRYPDGQFVVGRTVTFQIDGTTVGTAVTQSNYIASLNYTIPASLGPGTHTLKAVFAGDSDYNASSQTSTLTVSYNTLVQLPNVSGTAGKSVLLRAAIRRYPDGVFLAGQTVTFQVDGTTVGTAVTQSNFIASLSYTIPANMSSGSHTLKAIFAGGGGYNASSQTATLTVNP